MADWTADWIAPDERLRAVERALREEGWIVRYGGDEARWDLEVRGGILGSARFLMAVEDHGAGNQYVRTRIWPRVGVTPWVLVALLAALALAAGWDRAWPAAAALGLAAVLFAGRIAFECARASGALASASSPDRMIGQPGTGRAARGG
jgi:hypothetical protein